MMNNDPALDRLFKALCDGHRRAMMDRLAAGPLSVSDLAAPLDISLPAVMQHLSVLEAAGLLHSEKRGRVRTCTLSPRAMTQAEVWISDRRRRVEGQLTRLQQYLEQSEKDEK